MRAPESSTFSGRLNYYFGAQPSVFKIDQCTRELNKAVIQSLPKTRQDMYAPGQHIMRMCSFILSRQSFQINFLRTSLGFNVLKWYLQKNFEIGSFLCGIFQYFPNIGFSASLLIEDGSMHSRSEKI